MEKKEFQQLLDRYLRGQCSKDEIQLLEQWFEQIADKSFWLSESERIEMEERIYNDLQKNITSIRKIEHLPRRPVFLKYGMAAAIVSMLALACWWLVYSKTELFGSSRRYAQVSEGNVMHENVCDTTEIFTLPDGSKVTLKPGSYIEYNPHFGFDMREVKLTGEAFFDVVKDSKKPFYVYGGSVVTKVLGTSFSVKAPAHSTVIQVAVKTGRVSVYRDHESKVVNQDQPISNGVILTPNQKVIYFTEENHWVTSLVDVPQALQTEEKQKSELVFNNTRLQEIVKRIEKDYGIEIIIEDEKILRCTFTGDVSEMALYDALNFIGKSIGTEYEIRGTKILINGKGCD